MYYVKRNDYDSELQHHGILGMKWGIRKYQNPDGSLTPAGRKRYASDIKKAERAAFKSNAGRSTGQNYDKAVADFNKEMKNDSKYRELSKKAYDAEKKD